MQTKLPAHLQAIIDNPEKRAVLENMIKMSALKSLERGDKLIFSKVDSRARLTLNKVFVVKEKTNTSLYLQETNYNSAAWVRFELISDAEFRKV
jgi:hypothetical protein